MRDKFKIIHLTLILLSFGLARISMAQDAVFSQFFNTTLYLNPALAGIEDDFIVNINHRTQWSSLNFPYTTSQVSLIMPYYSAKDSKSQRHVGGIGLSVYNDIAGENKSFKTTGANATAAYNLPLDHDFVNQITFGLQIGMINKNVNTSQLQWGAQYSPFIGFDSSITAAEVDNFQNRTFIDVNSGIFWWHNPIDNHNKIIHSINSGVSIAHMNNPNESVLSAKKSHLPLLYKYHGSILFNIAKNATISANVLFAFQNSTTQENLGSYFSYKVNSLSDGYFKDSIIRFGTWIRINDSAILLTEIETSAFKFAFSYDMNTSSLRYNNRGIGTYEIHIGLKLSHNVDQKFRY